MEQDHNLQAGYSTFSLTAKLGMLKASMKVGAQAIYIAELFCVSIYLSSKKPWPTMK